MDWVLLPITSVCIEASSKIDSLRAAVFGLSANQLAKGTVWTFCGVPAPTLQVAILIMLPWLRCCIQSFRHGAVDSRSSKYVYAVRGRKHLTPRSQIEIPKINPPNICSCSQVKATQQTRKTPLNLGSPWSKNRKCFHARWLIAYMRTIVSDDNLTFTLVQWYWFNSLSLA